MVDRTAEAFGMDEPVRGSRGRNVPRRDRVEDQTEEAFKPRIDYMSLPAGANPDKDVVVGQTELGEPVYQTMMGTKYSLKTVTPEPKQWETEPQTMARAGEVLKSYATGAAEGIMNAPAEIWESMETLAGTSDRAATYGDVLNLAGLPATGAIPSIARGAIEGVDRDVLYSTPAGQAGGKPKRPLVPRFEQQPLPDFTDKISTLKTKFSNEIEQARERGSEASVRMLNRELSVLNLDNNDLFNDIIKIYDAEDPRYASKQVLSKYDDIIPQDVTPYNLEVLSGSLRYLTDYESSAILGSSETRFRSPIESVVQQLEYPRDGIKGSQFLKELKDNPDVRDSEVAGIGLDIDPQKRYTQQELMDAVSGRLYDVTVQYKDNYMSYQRQRDVGFDDSRQIDYFELVINAEPRGDNPGFKANSQHYGKNTLAHTRGSVQEDSAGEYIFVEEMQSDLLQKGFDESPRGPSPDDVYSQFQIRPRESTIEGVIKASPEEIQKGMSMAVLREEMEKLTGKDFDNADNTLEAFTAKSTEGEWASYMLFRTIHTDYLQYDPNVPVEVAKEAFNDIKDYITKNSVVKLNPPPIAKTEESVRLTIDALMAEGQTRGVSRIVIPPLEKIVEARFGKGSGSYKKALDPKSGFYATYVTSVNKVLDKYKKEFGDDFIVNNIELSYNGDKLQGTEIDFSGLINKNYNLTRPRFAQGGMVDYNTETQMNRLMQEGGIADDGMRRDPVSGNEIPPGSMATEVRDDIPAQLSEGEYIVPADVLRYYGVAFFEQLRAKAKRGLAEMEAGGRIGGEPVPMRNGMEMEDEEDDLDDEDEMMLNEVMGMAQGGMMTSQPQQANNYYGLQPTMNIDRQTVRAFQEGGLNAAKPIDVNNPAASLPQFTSSFDPSKFRPGFMFDQGQQQPTQPAPQTEMRTYVNDRGEIRMIPFQNGQPLEPIPEGFYPQGQQPVKTQAQEGTSDQEQVETVDRAQEWAATNYERILTDPLSAAADTEIGMAGELIGTFVPGISSLMKIDRIQQLEAISDLARSNGMVDEADTIKSQAETLKGELGFIGKGLYGLIGKTNNYTSALQNQAGVTSATTAVTGGGTARPSTTATTGGGAAPAAPAEDRDTGEGGTQRTAREEARRATGLAQQAAKSSGASPGATGTGGQTAPSGQVTMTGKVETSGQQMSNVGGFDKDKGKWATGAMAKGGLMQKPKPKKPIQKRKIKTVST